METDKTVLLISSAVFTIMLVFAFIVSSDFPLATNIMFLAVLALTLPYSLFKFMEFKRLKEYEGRFPNFLRDLAESKRAGMSIIEAVHAASKTDYGSLSREIKKMSDQLSWNITLDDVLKGFARRMIKSKIIVRSLMIIDQANKSGGNIEDAMDSLASNIELLKDVQEEKSTLLNQHVMMMYAIFFMFLGITIALLKFLIPILQTQADTSQMSSSFIANSNPNPCFECISGDDPACISCQSLFVVSGALDFGQKENPAAYYRALFFLMIIVQGFFTGLIAGQIGSDSAIAGIKHSMIFLFSGFLIFIISTRLGFI